MIVWADVVRPVDDKMATVAIAEGTLDSDRKIRVAFAGSVDELEIIARVIEAEGECPCQVEPYQLLRVIPIETNGGA